jgi:zinc D-Ala-D-Ala carboxypeptidase
MNYSEHFTREELIGSDTAARLGIDNTPPADVEANLRRLCEVLERVRAAMGPIFISSGYRCLELNTAIGGSKTSRHMDGCAADTGYANESLRTVANHLIEHAQVLGIDQVIYEFGRWVHIGIALPGHTPRHEGLMIFSAREGYLKYDPNDPRVK